MKLLKLASELDLPLDAVTEKLAWLGRTGSGKSYGASKLAELMLEAGAQVVVLDIVGIWYGLRMGKGAFKIPVFGGLHGDVPLEPTAGALVADLIVEREMSAVVDISQMLDSEKSKFARDFADRFFYRKKSQPSAVHLFLEECQELVPQNCQRGEERMLHAFERLVKLGRNFGIGVSLISQRPQEVNKKALNQVECVFAFQMTGVHERKAIEYWIADKGIDIDVQALLPKLKVGEPHVWSPRWLDVSKRVRILQKRTLDTSSTPKVGVKAQRPQELSRIDIQAIREQMEGLIERAKSEDPVALRKRITELEKQLGSKKTEQVLVPVFNDSAFSEVRRLVGIQIDDLRRSEIDFQKSSRASVEGILSLLDEYRQQMKKASGKLTVSASPSVLVTSKAPRTEEPMPSSNGLGKAELSLLGAIKLHGTLSLYQAAIVAGYSPAASTKDVAISKLRHRGLVDGSNAALTLTSSGAAHAQGVELPHGQALAQHWFGVVGKCPREILQFVIRNAPLPVTREQVAKHTGYSTGASTIDVGLAKLRKLGLIQGKNDAITANDKLVEG